MFVFVVVFCMFLEALWSPAGKALLNAVFHVVCHFPICVLINIKTKG